MSVQVDQEQRLVAAAKAGEPGALERVIDAYMPRIASVARIYRGAPGIERDELLQEGVVGLLEALRRYDPERRTPFWAYARLWVRRSMQRLVAELTRPVVMSDYALRQLSRLRDAQRRLYEEYHREPTPSELAETTGLPLESVEQLLAADRPPRSLQDPLTTEDGGVYGRLEDRIADPRAEEDFEHLLDVVEAQQLLDQLTRLSERERSALDEDSQQTAERLGVSTNRAQRIHRRARAKRSAAARRA